MLREEGVARSVAAACAVRRPGGMGGAWELEVGGDAETFYDLASLTKPMTAIAAARTVPLETTLGAILPELHASASGEATLAALLSHRAGLLAHVPLYLPLASGDPFDATYAIRTAADSRREECTGPIPEGGFPPIYSDVGYILAGVALARHDHRVDAGACIEELVARPLGLERELGTARSLEALGVDLVGRAAPTEDVAWRGGVVRGRVHDENAWALTREGGSGHAGMFGTVRAVLELATTILDGLALTGPLEDARIDLLTRERRGGTLRMGFDGKAPEGSSAGESFGPRSFGHLGFTGTSFWIDPDAEVVAVLLTNRVYPSRESTAIRAARPRAHDALFMRALELRT
jgi:serine-type D-Ala-D-Ala carboxypeptidase